MVEGKGRPDEARPLCFVLMPFGDKNDAKGRRIDFDAVYGTVFAPAVEAAGMEPLRADEERGGGIIHKPMFERLVLCPFAVADLTLANANVFYELGVRHAVRPHTTVLLYEQAGQRLPFDTAPLRALPYVVDAAGRMEEPDKVRKAITDRLEAARDPADDSPLYQLLDGISPPDIARLKTDVFRDRVRYSQRMKDRLSAARRTASAAIEAAQRVGPDAVEAAQQQARTAVGAVHQELRPIADIEAGLAIDLMLAYRDVGAWGTVVQLVEEMSPPVRASVLVQEQLAMAFNRQGRSDEAEGILNLVLDVHGPSSETYGLLGRISKDRWQQALNAGQTLRATAHLSRAIAAYRQGFETDWRDAFPGVNALTLLEVQQPGQPQVRELLPVLRYAVERRLALPRPDYWDHASMLEIAVVDRDDERARRELGECMALDPPEWMRLTTASNLRLIHEARRRRGDETSLAREVADALHGPSSLRDEPG